MNDDETREERLRAYFDRIGKTLGNVRRAGALSIYLAGLLSRLERKNVESIVATALGAGASSDEVDALHQRLLHVIGQATWSDDDVRASAERYAMEALPASESVNQLIVDDTGWLKQGRHSVGVQRQYTGSTGKVTNCQVGVSVVAATEKRQIPLDYALYLPESWLTPAKRKVAKIPADVSFATKPQLAAAMLKKIRDRGVLPLCRVVADSGYGNSSAFRCDLRAHGHELAVGVRGDTTAWSVDEGGNRRGPRTSIEAIANRLPTRRIGWREGTKGTLSGTFGARRVIPVREYEDYGMDEPVWLLREVERADKNGEQYAFITAPKTAQLRELVLTWKERYRIERSYQDGKENCGLDHFQGRSYRGWHHHISAVLVCIAFLCAEQCKRSHPTGRRQAIRSSERFERHFPDSIATLQRVTSRGLGCWLPSALVAASGAPACVW